MAKDLCESYELVASIHAEGSLAAQRMSIHAVAEFDRYKAAAKRAAGIDGGVRIALNTNLP